MCAQVRAPWRGRARRRRQRLKASSPQVRTLLHSPSPQATEERRAYARSTYTTSTGESAPWPRPPLSPDKGVASDSPSSGWCGVPLMPAISSSWPSCACRGRISRMPCGATRHAQRAASSEGESSSGHVGGASERREPSRDRGGGAPAAYCRPSPCRPKRRGKAQTQRNAIGRSRMRPPLRRTSSQPRKSMRLERTLAPLYSSAAARCTARPGLETACAPTRRWRPACRAPRA